MLNQHDTLGRVRTDYLLGLMVLLLLVAALFCFRLLYQSFLPNPQGDARLPRLDVSQIPANHYQIVDDPSFDERMYGFQSSILFVRLNNGRLLAWRIGVRDGDVGMPDYWWWRPSYPCKKFAPTLVNQQINEQSEIRCFEMLDDSWGEAARWRWRVTGQRLANSSNTPYFDLEPFPGMVEGKYFVVNKIPGYLPHRD